ncbi:Transcriptional regulator, Crp/Fnr family [Brevinematales bacterium NS]|nr:Crp/Fnr family transcriptional regulator [Brevinematales bacterium]QJR22572.1 Transcriptional regulator, Crp/Fnr family [Brevinematales bacterium NS]
MDALEKFERSYNGGDIIFCEYEPGDEFYIIKEGKVRLTKIQDNREKTLDIIEPPAIFGEMAIIDNAPRNATAIAETPVRLVVLQKQNFYELLVSNPKWALSLIKIFSKRIFDATRKLEILSLKDDEAKVLDTLLMLCELKGIVPATYDKPDPIVLEGVTVESVAYWCGIDVKECEKYIMRYHNMGRIERRGDQIVVKNLPDIYRLVKNKRKLQEKED